MSNAIEFESYCNQLLSAAEFDDYCPNGLQVEAGGDEVLRLVSGVTASQALIDAAVEAGADMLLVHHGFFWKGESPVLTGPKGRRIAALIRNHISLMVYHLPLDAHPHLGNNSLLGGLLGLGGGAPLEAGGAAVVSRAWLGGICGGVGAAHQRWSWP